VAATVLLFGIVGAMQAISIGSEMLDTARKQSIATQLIEAELERIRSLPWDDSDSTADEACIRDLPDRTTSNPISPPGYLSALAGPFTVTRAGFTWKSSSEGRMIRVTVRWRSLRGVTLTRSGDGYYSKSGWQQSYQSP